ncbi:alpha/beta fold hydrolase [Kitasatospora sp. NPDC096147]|uniref:alpha/beta fold hydrolase n=1 Tax=Kitasatospora sp. NPDC096147 TaxID=3364093 RepID=UPI0037FB2506
MKLHTREWGTGDRIALLVHGIMSDHRTWRRFGPALAERGYRVIAVDLRGHGESPRGEGATPAEKYGPQAYADDLVETLPAGAELAVGHSLGGLSLRWAVERLRPQRAVFSDPAWLFDQPAIDPELFVGFADGISAEQVAAMNPRWADEDVATELATVALWDRDTARSLTAHTGHAGLPEAPVVPSLVQLADPSFLVSPEQAELLRGRGFEVRTVAGAGHTIHRDDFEGFLSSLEGWI